LIIQGSLQSQFENKHPNKLMDNTISFHKKVDIQWQGCEF